MGLVGDDSEPLALRGGQLTHGVEREREGLDGADDDLLVAGEGLGQLTALAAVFAYDGGDNALLPLEGEQGLLKLAVDDVAVGDDQNAVEDLLCFGVVEVREEMRRPRDGVRFA